MGLVLGSVIFFLVYSGPPYRNTIKKIITFKQGVRKGSQLIAKSINCLPLILVCMSQVFDLSVVVFYASEVDLYMKIIRTDLNAIVFGPDCAFMS